MCKQLAKGAWLHHAMPPDYTCCHTLYPDSHQQAAHLHQVWQQSFISADVKPHQPSDLMYDRPFLDIVAVCTGGKTQPGAFCRKRSHLSLQFQIGWYSQ